MVRSAPSYAAIAVMVSLICGTSCSSALDPAEQFTAANRAVDEWVAQHPAEWSVSLGSEPTLYRPDFSTSCSQGGKNNLVALTFGSTDTEIDFYFTCPLGPTAGVDDLRAAFAFVVLTRLPHGIQTPGWRFRLYTPTSSVRDVVTFDAAANGAVAIGIDTPLHTIGGMSLHPSCEPPVDAPALPGCSVSREHRIPLRVTLLARLDGSELE